MYFKMPWSGEKLVKYNIPRTGETDPDEEQETFFSNTHQLQLFALRPPKQLLKWVGNKQKYASQIANLKNPGSYFASTRVKKRRRLRLVRLSAAPLSRAGLCRP